MTTSGRPTQDKTNMDVRATQRMLSEGCLRSRGHAGRQQALTRMGVLVTTGALVLSPFPAPAIALESDGSSAGSATAAEGQRAQPDEGAPPAKPEGDSPDGAGASSTPGVSPSDAPDAQAPGGTGQTDAQSFDYQGSYAGTLTADGESVSSEDQIATSTASDLVAALVQNGGTLTVSGSTLGKTGDDGDGDRCNFYGVNSILLSVGEGSLAKVSDSTLTSDSTGSNALFATDSGTIWANGVTIRTSADNSRGLDATYGGTIVANGLSIETAGAHCAACATDRGGGRVSVTNSTLRTAGVGSPLVYSTGDIELNGCAGTATGSQLVAMEGLNTVLIGNSTLEGTLEGKSASDPIADGIIIYQSTSGDAEASTGKTATFQAKDSTLRSAIASGSMFYLTNTSADIVLSNTTLDFDSSAASLLIAAGNDSNGWGTAGKNGATARLTGIGQTLEGNIESDTISQVDVFLTEGTTWTGAAEISENATASTSDSPLSVSVDSSSSWVVAADSTVSNLTVESGGRVVDTNGKTVTIMAGGKTVVQGDSGITVTVSGSYSTDYDASAAGSLASEAIDRSAFDEEYGTQTAFSMDGSAASGQREATESQGGSGNWWDGFLSFWRGVFGMGG
ncbi:MULTISPECIES: hypothetical protein [Atopobiaceae]|uniref:Uncharacterized protein n=1 Tax=Parafannyhessea umbonata TaxID=604330 RepID=A0A1H6HZ33_9ACTN|nr:MULTISPECIES: hypothetical protein [Atopobiaceae]SEH41589.1 hypothetical protein SAMN05216447_10229 [Parafannyhessea umbonata]SJZ55231.1 hypothetical protein SAMN06298223_0690 [Olsenella sp. KH1P3]